MNKMMKLGCTLIGWNSTILNECGEASKRQLIKLVSAISIMMILWGTIGYCFSADYMNITSVAGRIGVAIAFMFIILCIERVVILSGKSKMMVTARCILAGCMALLGSCVFDQMIFRNDIQHELAQNKEDKIAAIEKKRSAEINATLMLKTQERDSISNYNDMLYKEIAANPATVIKAKSVQQVPTMGADGRTIMKTVQSTNETVVNNPRTAQAKENEDKISDLKTDIEKLREEKKNISKTIRNEVDAQPIGFLEELKATTKVIGSSPVSMIFYGVMFAFLIGLELLVLTIKAGDTKCDYDLRVERQLSAQAMLMKKIDEAQGLTHANA